MRFGIVTIGSIVLMMGGCATVPDDAPVEFHNAKAAIDRMEEQDADEDMPETAERAEDSFDEALDLWDDYTDNEEGVTRIEAVSKATEAGNMAEDATAISQQIREWDKSYNNLEQALADLESAEVGVAVVDVSEPTSPFARLKGTEIYSTVAYFDTNAADEAEVNEPEMDALANILKKSDSYKVTLTGYADHRGSSEYNEQLGKQRAQTVAQQLYSKGIAKQQVQVQSAGEKQAKEAQEPGALQLDRKVQAKVVLQ